MFLITKSMDLGSSGSNIDNVVGSTQLTTTVLDAKGDTVTADFAWEPNVYYTGYTITSGGYVTITSTTGHPAYTQLMARAAALFNVPAYAMIHTP